MRAAIPVIVLCGVSHPAYSQAVIGDASRAINAVTGAIGARRAAIVTGSNVHQNETVSTGPAAEADLLFLDKTTLHVASASSVKLDRYVYNSDGSARGAIVSMARGAFRFTTGQSSPSAFRLQTPHALIGIRGTVLDIDVGRGVTQVTLTQGAADTCLRSNPRSCATLDRPGQTVRVSNTSLNGDGVQDNPARTQPTQRASTGSDTALVAQMVSQHRAANGFSAVQLDPRLVRLAQSQADAMARRTSMSHDVAGDFDARMSGAACVAGRQKISQRDITASVKCFQIGRSQTSTMPICCILKCAKSVWRAALAVTGAFIGRWFLPASKAAS